MGPSPKTADNTENNLESTAGTVFWSVFLVADVIAMNTFVCIDYSREQFNGFERMYY